MARLVKNPKIDTRSARARLAARTSSYWTHIDRGRQLGYRKGAKSAVWIAKIVSPDLGLRKECALGIADDVSDADGRDVLTYSQAQEKAREWFVAAEAEARREASPAPDAPLTVREACLRYVAYLEAEKRTGKDADQRLKKHVIPKLGDINITDLTLTELEEWRNGLVARDEDDDPDAERRSKDTANRLLNYLKAALNRLMLDPSNNIADDRAWRFLKPFRDVGKARDVHLDHDQIARLLSVTTGAFKTLITGALLTGCRAGELKAMDVRHFNTKTGTLHVPDRPGCKTGERDVTLTNEGADFFKTLAKNRPLDDALFLTDSKKRWNKSDHHRSMDEATKAAELPDDSCFYTMRHTYASQSLMAGMNTQLLAENMGTSVVMIEKHYGKFTKEARKAQIERSALKLGLGKGG